LFNREEVVMPIEKSKILLVDDEIKTCKLFSKFLIKQGFDVQTASDGKMAMVKADELLPDCILLDVRMPYGGLGLLMRLRKELPGSVIIMMSAFTAVDQMGSFLNEGAYACIEKPVDLNDLLETIKKALKL
jgi:two-component system, NtrC family, response regulator AtoC